jgi:hypothetical protein
MTARPDVLAVHRAAYDEPCGRCGGTITCGRRAAQLAGIGDVHLACVIARYDTEENNAVPEPVRQPEPQAAVVGDIGEDAADPWAEQPAAAAPQSAATPPAVEDNQDPRAMPWWDR